MALLLDGGFVKKKLEGRLQRFPSTRDVVSFCDELMQRPRLQQKDLFRVFFYDAPPLEGQTTNPIAGRRPGPSLPAPGNEFPG